MAQAATHFTMYVNFFACFAVLDLFLCANLCWFLQVSKRSVWVIIKRQVFSALKLCTIEGCLYCVRYLYSYFVS